MLQTTWSRFIISLKMASLFVVRSTFARLPSARLITNSAVRGAQNPHGGDGTAYKERERAAEAQYIRKAEEAAAKAHGGAKKVRRFVSDAIHLTGEGAIETVFKFAQSIVCLCVHFVFLSQPFPLKLPS